ncbi:MAG: hypothetical protein BWK80_38830 [Desulfobacteraceae bacterium IS3]|nr:MAG: hypothetical protein BWK80_38830 [Desulfobacteraceae bacterium IS3]
MARKKSHSFDAMVKFFMQQYDIPTKKDIEKLITKLNHLELVLTGGTPSSQPAAPAKQKAEKSPVKKKTAPVGRSKMTASDTVLQVIKDARQGIGFNEIREKTGFEDKKLRNIIFRLNITGRIKRKERGIYVIS